MLRLDSSNILGLMYDGVGQNIKQLQVSERESQSCSLGDKSLVLQIPFQEVYI